MKVLHVFNSLKYSGAEIMYVDAAESFRKRGIHLSALITSLEVGEYSSRFIEEKYDIFQIAVGNYSKIVGRLKFFFNFIRLLEKGKFDIVHIHRSDLMFLCSFTCFLKSVKTVYTFHNVFNSRTFTWHYPKLQRKLARDIFKCRFQSISHSVYLNELEKYNNRTHLVDNWYSPARFFPALPGEKRNLREALNINQSATVVISVGGCSHIKRHHEILDAIAKVRERNEDILYLHLGTGDSENIEMSITSELKIDKVVRFVGNQSDVRKYLVASDLYVMTSKFEGISISTIEAMACEIPTILYDVPGLRDFNLLGDNAVLISEDSLKLSKEILNFVENNKQFLKFAWNAKEYVTSKYNMSANVDKIIELYN